MSETVSQFWNNIFADGQSGEYSRVEFPDPNSKLCLAVDSWFGDVRGKRVLDIGCGSGKMSLHLASRGAIVTAIDISDVAIENLNAFVRDKSIENLTAVCMSATDIQKLGQFDCVFGSMVLHHIEPFDEFVKTLRGSMIESGRGFFYENNGSSRLLMWCRKHLTGKAWIPKFGDPEEHPLTPQEIRQMRSDFQVEQEFPELMLFSLVSNYLLRGKCGSFFYGVDRLLYRTRLKRISYRQYVKLIAK